MFTFLVWLLNKLWYQVYGNMNNKLNIKKISWPVLFAALWVFPVEGQPLSMTVEECMRFGIERNLKVKDTRLDTRIARNNYISSLGEFIPSIEAFGTGGKRFGRSVDPRTNLYTSTSFVESNLGLNVTVPLFCGFIRMNRAGLEKLNRQIKQLDVEVARNQIAFEIMDAFFSLVLEEHLFALGREQYGLTQQYKRQMEVFLETGMRSKADMQEMEARLRGDLYQVTYRNNTKEMALLRLKQLLDIPESDSLHICYVPENMDETRLPAVQADSLYLNSLNKLPEAQAFDLKLAASRKKLAIAKGDFYPALHAEYVLATGFVNTEKRDDGRAIPFGFQLHDHLNHYIGLRVSIPLFGGLKKITALKNERLDLQKTGVQVAREKQQLRMDVENACLSLHTGLQEYRKASEQAKAEEINLRIIHRKWEEGLVSLFELMEVRNRFIAAKAERTRTEMQYVIRKKTLGFYETGTFF